MSLPEKTGTTHLHIASMCLFEDCSKPLPQSTFSITQLYIPHTQVVLNIYLQVLLILLTPFVDDMTEYICMDCSGNST